MEPYSWQIPQMGKGHGKRNIARLILWQMPGSSTPLIRWCAGQATSKNGANGLREWVPLIPGYSGKMDENGSSSSKTIVSCVCVCVCHAMSWSTKPQTQFSSTGSFSRVWGSQVWIDSRLGSSQGNLFYFWRHAWLAMIWQRSKPWDLLVIHLSLYAWFI